MSDPMVTGCPESIWLIYGEVDTDTAHDECHEIGWCDEPLWPADVRYVRGDVADRHAADAAALRRERDELAARLAEIEAQEPVAWEYDCLGWEPVMSTYRRDVNEFSPTASERPLYARPVPAQAATPERADTRREGLSQEQADRLKQEVNTVACLSLKSERHAKAIRVKRLINDMTLPT